MPSFHFHIHPLLKILLLTLVIQPSLCIIPDDPTFEIIVNICERTPDRYFCRDFLEQNIPSPSTDARTFVQITIRQVLLNVTNTLKAVRQTKARSSKEVADLLTICEEGYSVVSNEYQDASLAFAKRDIQSVLFDEQKTVRPIANCAININPVLPQFKIYNTQNLALQRISVAAAVNYQSSKPKGRKLSDLNF